MTPHLDIVQLSMEKLKGFVEDDDQNLKYLGLLAMGNFMKVSYTWHLKAPYTLVA
jgi:hypothetical protein